MKLLIKHGRVVDPVSGTVSIQDLYIENGKVVQLEKDIRQEADQVIDADGLVVCPGLVDMHVHLRDPGLVVPPALEAAARDILVADYINGTKNTMQGTAKPLVVPQLAGHDSAWYLLCASRPIRPLIWQQRKKPKFVSKTAETDDNVFMRKTFLYGADYRGNAGFGFWQMAYGGDGTAE